MFKIGQKRQNQMALKSENSVRMNSQNLMNDILFDKGQICVNVINFLGGTLEINIFGPIVRCDNMLPHTMIKAIDKGKCLNKCLTAA